VKVYYCEKYNIIALHDETHGVFVVSPKDRKLITELLNYFDKIDMHYELIGEL
jgi:hypothetical protein